MSRLSRQGKIVVWGIILIFLAIFIMRFYANTPVQEIVVEPIAFVATPGTYCFSRNQIATPDEPYSAEEHIVLHIADDKTVSGTKTGNQAGPDMTNGYTGTLSGALTDNTMELTYAYTVEGSSAKELEVYVMDTSTLTKKRWVLVEQDKVLVPDRVGDPKLIVYTKENCPDATNTTTDQALVEQYIRANIKTLAPEEPILGGNWYVISVTTDMATKSGTMVYEDGHIQGKATFKYTVSGGAVTVSDIKKQ